ncbi:acetyl-CoA synthetase-like protein [Aureobasidium pullulans]|uniref:Acetyl-CoA synthetase-like protein n=1 Tax=Aureobasidium pullulans TaxID=5580 RepID=A0A4S8YK84_AURPU|nr:acetyl-CoA synthetase-like protein [Aureobasidium pullulans]
MTSNGPAAEFAKAIGGEPELGCMYNILKEAATKHPDSIALVCPRYPSDLYTFSNQSDDSKSQPYLRWTYRHLQQVSHAVAAGLYQKGIRPGMTIAIFPVVGAEFQIIARAAWELRCTLASIDPASISNPNELQHMLKCSNPSVVLAPTTELAEKLDKNAENTLHGHVLKFVTSHKQTSCPHGWSPFQELFDFGQKHQDLDFSQIEHELDDEILVIFTSGTTSLPKGCVHTNTSMSASCLAKKNLGQAADYWPVVSAHGPLFHAIGIMIALHVPPCTIVHPSESFAPGALLEVIQNEKITYMCLVPAMLNLLAEHQNLQTTDTSSLEMIHMGGGNVLSRHNQDCVNVLKSKKAHTIYGMSECWSPTCYHVDQIPDLKRSDVGCGVVMAGSMLKVCAPDSTTALKRNEAGELHMGGPQILKKYIGAKSQPFYEDEDGRWFPTGDQATMNQDGEFFIVGRYKELIIRGGHNIAPTAIEKVLSAYGGIQSQVVGIEDETAGEVPIAVVRSQGLSQVDLDLLRRTTIEKLGSAYAPEMILTLKDLDLDDFPKTTSGKLRKQTLQPLVQKYVDAQRKGDSDTDGNLMEKLCSVWSKALNHKSIKTQDIITDMADSLVLSRGRTFLRRDLGINITGEEILEHNTVAKQARLLASRTGTNGGQDYKDLQTTREGPPQLNDMIHTFGSEERATMTREHCEPLLQPLGLSWADVEDVYPMPDMMNIWAHPLRKQSVNHRHAFVVDSDNVQQVQKALEKVLNVHNSLRSISVDIDPEITCYAILRASTKFFSNCILTFEKPVKIAKDLQSFLLNDGQYDFAGPPGLLNRFYLVPIEDTQKIGLLFLGQHSCFDALSSLPFYEDLDKALSSEKETVAQRVPFKLWAEHYFSGRTSLTAKLGVEYHVKRLTGISKSESALFPRQKAAEWFKGHHFGWKPDPTVHKDQGMIDARLEQQSYIGVEGKASVIHTPDLSNLKKAHGLDAAIVLKAALSFVNTGETGATEALFASYQAGRSWPFVAPWMQERLPSAMDIAGPTIQVAIERINTSKPQSVIDFLKHLTSEQEELTNHVHAPLLAIRDALSTADAETMEQVRRRQIFNWLPRSSGLDEYTNLNRVQLWSRTDVGILWNCTAIDGDEVKIHVSWDDAQLNEDEIDKLLSKFGRMVEMLSAETNWEKDVNDLVREHVHHPYMRKSVPISAK